MENGQPVDLGRLAANNKSRIEAMQQRLAAKKAAPLLAPAAVEKPAQAKPAQEGEFTKTPTFAPAEAPMAVPVPIVRELIKPLKMEDKEKPALDERLYPENFWEGIDKDKIQAELHNKDESGIDLTLVLVDRYLEDAKEDRESDFSNLTEVTGKVVNIIDKLDFDIKSVGEKVRNKFVEQSSKYKDDLVIPWNKELGSFEKGEIGNEELEKRLKSLIETYNLEASEFLLAMREVLKAGYPAPIETKPAESPVVTEPAQPFQTEDGDKTGEQLPAGALESLVKSKDESTIAIPERSKKDDVADEIKKLLREKTQVADYSTEKSLVDDADWGKALKVPDPEAVSAEVEEWKKIVLVTDNALGESPKATLEELKSAGEAARRIAEILTSTLPIDLKRTSHNWSNPYEVYVGAYRNVEAGLELLDKINEGKVTEVKEAAKLAIELFIPLARMRTSLDVMQYIQSGGDMEKIQGSEIATKISPETVGLEAKYQPLIQQVLYRSFDTIEDKYKDAYETVTATQRACDYLAGLDVNQMAKNPDFWFNSTLNYIQVGPNSEIRLPKVKTAIETYYEQVKKQGVKTIGNTEYGPEAEALMLDFIRGVDVGLIENATNRRLADANKAIQVGILVMRQKLADRIGKMDDATKAALSAKGQEIVKLYDQFHGDKGSNIEDFVDQAAVKFGEIVDEADRLTGKASESGRNADADRDKNETPEAISQQEQEELNKQFVADVAAIRERIRGWAEWSQPMDNDETYQEQSEEFVQTLDALSRLVFRGNVVVNLRLALAMRQAQAILALSDSLKLQHEIKTAGTHLSSEQIASYLALTNETLQKLGKEDYDTLFKSEGQEPGETYIAQAHKAHRENLRDIKMVLED